MICFAHISFSFFSRLALRSVLHEKLIAESVFFIVALLFFLHCSDKYAYIVLWYRMDLGALDLFCLFVWFVFSVDNNADVSSIFMATSSYTEKEVSEVGFVLFVFSGLLSIIQV